MNKLFCILSLMTVIGCATHSGHIHDRGLEAQAKKFQTTPGQSALYLYRPYKFFASAVSTHYIVNEQYVGLLGDGFFKIDVAPGIYTVKAKFKPGFSSDDIESAPVVDTKRFKIEPNEIVYIKFDVHTKKMEKMTDHQLAQKEVRAHAMLQSQVKDLLQQDFDHWPKIKKTQSIAELQKFIDMFPKSQHVSEAKNLIKKLKEQEKNAFDIAIKKNTIQSYHQYLKKYSAQGSHVNTVLSSLLSLISNMKDKNKQVKEMVRISSKYPALKEQLPDEYHIYGIGPKGLTVGELINLKSRKIGDSLIIQKINKAPGKYKDFSFDEIDLLKQKGISEKLIEAMITKKELAPKEPRPRVPAMASTSSAPTRVQTQKAPEQSGVTNTIANCLQNVTLKKMACDKMPWPASTVCHAALPKCN